MSYSQDDINIIKPEEHIIKRQDMYFGPEGASPLAICCDIEQGAITLGATDTEFKEEDGWWYVSANIDWLSVPSKVKTDEISIFNTIHGFPEAGVNWYRSEAMARIFSISCFTIASSGPVLISGTLPTGEEMENILAKRGNWARSIIFKFQKKYNKAIKNRPQKARPTTPEKRRVLWQRYA
ncbi:MAG: hypothetical protein R2747_14015 [Pyrinomonadaceae bacterium]